MSAGYLLDTNICIYFLNAQHKAPSRRSKEEAAVWERFVAEPGRLHLSHVSVGELLLGAYRSEKRDDNLRRLEILLEMAPARPVAFGAWKLFGKTKAELSSKGLTVPDLDLVIACSARVDELALVTNDRAFDVLPAEFRRESWV